MSSLLNKLKASATPGSGSASNISTPKKEESASPAKELGALSLEEKRKCALTDFYIDRTLGTGSFGRVHLVRLKATGKYYAMKVLRKGEVVKMKQVEHTINEKNILESLNHPFLVNALGFLQDSSNLYMVLEYVQGGELFSYLRKSGVSFWLGLCLTVTHDALIHLT
jgi:hypothetical protein